MKTISYFPRYAKIRRPLSRRRRFPARRCARLHDSATRAARLEARARPASAALHDGTGHGHAYFTSRQFLTKPQQAPMGASATTFYSLLVHRAWRPRATRLPPPTRQPPPYDDVPAWAHDATWSRLNDFWAPPYRLRLLLEGSR